MTDLEPHLGALGHLVALGESDLGYLHVHPLTGGGTRAGEVAFAVETPTPGTRRLFFEFRHDGAVHTAELVAPTAGGAADPQSDQQSEQQADQQEEQPHGH